MAKVNVYNLKRESVGSLDLSDEVFGAEVNEALIYDVLKAQLASRRSGTAKVKGRAEVAGSTRKLLRQKGTGGARHGSIRTPIYAGGGQVHGPDPRSYDYRPPRQMRAGAMRSALSLKLKEGNLTVVDKFELPEIKTKNVASALKTLQLQKGTLVVDIKDNEKLRLSLRNLPESTYLPPEGVNLYDVLRHPNLVVTKDAALALQSRFEKACIMTPEQIIKRPLVLTEKGNSLREQENQYLFEVATNANKIQIRNAIETLFSVKVLKVHTLIMRGRLRRMGRGHAKTPNWKKAIVSLKAGDSIEFFEGAGS